MSTRLVVFFDATLRDESQTRSQAAFLLNAIMESKRHPEFLQTGGKPEHASREFFRWAIDSAVARGEGRIGSDVNALAEALLALFCGMVVHDINSLHPQPEMIDKTLRRLF